MTDRDDYDRLYQNFRWSVPEEFNIAAVCGRRWAAESSRIAIVFDGDDGRPRRLSYASMQADTNRCSNALAALGVTRGERVAIVLAQRPETAIAHLAVYQLGAIAVPLSLQFGAEALEFRLRDSGAVAAICDAGVIDTLVSMREHCPRLGTLIALGVAGDGVHEWSALLSRAADEFELVRTRAADPAMLIYTSGTTGPPKGALIPHSAMLGNLPGFVASQNWFPQADDVFWSPADWAWTGGLWDALLPSLYFGFPIVADSARDSGGRFSPERALDLMARHRVTNAFLFPTALKMIMRHAPEPRAAHDLRLRALMSAGEPVGSTVFDWCREALGVTVNEMFGQTEMNYIVGNSHQRWPARAGSIGRPYPGHRVAVIDEAGNEVPAGTPGEVAVHRRDIHGHPDPVFFIEYWNNPQATDRKFTGAREDSWCRTGDLAQRDALGYLWYQGRADDMFKAAGYRIGPSEIENCLLRHAAVANAAVVPKPDAERGAVIKAFVVLAPGSSPTEALARELQAHVRGRLAPYETPKEIEFIEQLPMTTTGKVQRRVLRDLEVERAKEARG